MLLIVSALWGGWSSGHQRCALKGDSEAPTPPSFSRLLADCEVGSSPPPTPCCHHDEMPQVEKHPGPLGHGTTQ